MKKLLVIALAMCAVAAYAQKPKVLSGDWDAIKNIKVWDVDVVPADGLMIHKEGNHNEFLDARAEEYNENRKGAGDEYVETWHKNFNDRYGYKFCELMNKYQEKFGTGVKMKPELEEFDGKVVIQPTWIYLGYVNPMMAQPSKVTTEISFQDADGNELCRILMEESPGSVNAFSGNMASQNMGFGGADVEGEFARITESFAKCGKDLSGYLGKKVYK